MEISINGKKADITLDTEKTLGEVLAGLENWIAASGEFRLSGITIDGKEIGAEAIASVFDQNIDTIQTLDASLSSMQELFIEALLETRLAIERFETIEFGERKNCAEQWKAGAAAALLAEKRPELYSLAEKTFAGEGLNPKELLVLIAEYLRELEDSVGELRRLEPIIADVTTRLEELPLDIQTGKDQKAAQTVQYFSTIAEKIFRLYNILKAAGFPVNEITAAPATGEKVSVAEYIAEFSNILKELLTAYEMRDAVLVGDLAEYELAPRLRILYMCIQAGIAEHIVDAPPQKQKGDM